MRGKIIKGVGGLYQVETDDGQLLPCKARGIFRKQEITPLIGDWVEVEGDSQERFVITKIEPRKNSLVRPAMANLDVLFIVISTVDPVPNFLIIDKTIAVAEYKNIEPILVVTKSDLSSSDPIAEIYQKSGFQVIVTNIQTGEGIEQIPQILSGRIGAFTGNSGVGKSTLLNRIAPDLCLPTSETSNKLGRGRHTTRHVELFPIKGGYIADTPGFSSLDIERYELILKDQLQFCFREFQDHIGDCKFTGCSHTTEKGCAVLAAINRGEILPTRHQSYLAMYDEVKNIKEWELASYGQR